MGTLLGLLLQMLGLDDIAGVGDGLVLPLAGCALGTVVGWAGWIRPLVLTVAPVLLFGLLIGLVPWKPLMDRWVRADPLPERPVDAIVVLSRGLSSDSLLDGNGADRLLYGLELLRAGLAPRLVTTRVVRYHDGVRITTDQDQRRLVALAAADSAWLVVDSVGVTRDEATGAARLLLPMGASEIVLVTQASHTRRACAVFEKVGFLVHCRPALERGERTAHAHTSRQRWSVFGALVYELMGMAKYRFRGWI
ncbi:MAG: YdcF family protein [Gemmatimonadetes bacterium]|nr:YdcF family protein [Gemmatimonadota bacterium]